MNKHLKLFSALLVLMLFAPVSMFVCPADAEAAQTLVENSWRYEGGQLVSDDASSEEDGIALLSMDALPDGVTAQGIDVSEHQGRIDWDAVKASGIDFAILRVGFGAPSFGGRVDYQFNRNISECERLGIPYGVYVYSYAFDNQQAADEASMVINCLSGHNPRLPVYYDLEDNSIIANGRQTGIALRAQVFCNRISAAGYEPGIYASLNWFNNILTDSVFKSSSWDHWIAQYNSQCDYTGNYSFWQYKSNGKVPGINGNVDMNYAYVDVSLYHWQLIDSTWYYAASNGKAYTGWLFQSGTWYWLEPDVGGAMATGLHECNGSLYWFNSSGAMATGWQNIDGKYYFLKDSGAMEGTTFTKDETQYTINADGSLANAKKKKNTGGGAYTLAFLDADTQAMADSLNELKADAFDGDEEEDYYDDDKKDYDKDASFILNGKLQQIAEHRLAMARSKGYGSSRIPDEGTLDDYLKSIGESTARRHTEIYLINCDDVTQAEEKLLRNHDSDEKKRVDRVIYYKEMGVAHQQVGDKHYYMIILMR